MLLDIIHSYGTRIFVYVNEMLQSPVKTSQDTKITDVYSIKDSDSIVVKMSASEKSKNRIYCFKKDWLSLPYTAIFSCDTKIINYGWNIDFCNHKNNAKIILDIELARKDNKAFKGCFETVHLDIIQSKNVQINITQLKDNQSEITKQLVTMMATLLLNLLLGIVIILSYAYYYLVPWSDYLSLPSPFKAVLSCGSISVYMLFLCVSHIVSLIQIKEELKTGTQRDGSSVLNKN